MRDVLQKLLRSADVPNPERAQLRWDEYRNGVDSPDPATRAAADAAFATLLAWYGGALYRHIWGFVRSDAAEDVFQEVLKKLHEKRRSPRMAAFQANVLPWLRKVAIRECVDAYRRAARRRGRESRAVRPEGSWPADSRGEVEEMLAVALARLPEEQRQAVALHYFEGLDRQEAAAALGINRDTLTARLDAALRRLRKLIPAPAAVALGGTLGVPAALTAGPPVLSPARLGELVAGAWKAAAPGWTLPKVAAAVLLALTFCGAVATAGWVLTREHQPAATQVPPAKPDPPRPPAGPVESLQDRNLRIVQDDIVARLRDIVQALYPPDNPVLIEGVRAFGSQVEVEFRVTHPPEAGMAARLRGRYCVHRRRLVVHSQLAGADSWSWVDPAKPFVISVRLSFGAVEVVRGRAEYAAAERQFDRLPPDARAEAELLRHLFGPPGGEVLLPAAAFVSGFDGGWVLMTGDRGLFSRDRAGQWRYAGECPGWFPVVVDGHVYCSGHGMIRSRPLAEPTAAWQAVCPEPPLQPGEKAEQLFAVGNRLYQAVQPAFHCSRPLGDPTAGWTRTSPSVVLWPNGLAATGESVFGNDTKRLYARPAADPMAKWIPVGPWPEGCDMLFADGDRLLAFGGPGPIYARPTIAGPEVGWGVVGRVHDPHKR